MIDTWLPHRRGFQKICPVCHEEFIDRKNKVFCTNACKNRYHNDANAEQRAHERDISGLLIKNERVLRELMKDHVTESAKHVSMETMEVIDFE